MNYELLKKNEKLLEKSIEAWKKILEDEEGGPVESSWDIECGRYDCPLCLEFNVPKMKGSELCKDCIIHEVTGKKFCEGTPVESFSYLLEEIGDYENGEVYPFALETLEEYREEEVEFLSDCLDFVRVEIEALSVNEKTPNKR
jgi:hypothetical protein